ncbi:uncharacterized protein LOC126795421 [Argentina anserina]|uniref:uncharacterized protein LOC126795421 n=1 Tax=Argentina anserina TaxID=57926 RepID=UPI002176805E|nr:uncharacterized protein LOC126795421 [Potentilla anserina]
MWLSKATPTISLKLVEQAKLRLISTDKGNPESCLPNTSADSSHRSSFKSNAATAASKTILPTAQQSHTGPNSSKSNCFPSLKFLHVTVHYSDSDSREMLFSNFPVLEDLIIDGNLQDSDAYNLDVSAPKLKRLQISIYVARFSRNASANNFVNYGCQIIVSADAPNLEEVEIEYECLVSYSLKNAICLRKAKIVFHVDDLEDCDDNLADICHAKYLKVSSSVFAALDSRYHSLLLTFSNLNHLKLQLQLQTLSNLVMQQPTSDRPFQCPETRTGFITPSQSGFTW